MIVPSEENYNVHNFKITAFTVTIFNDGMQFPQFYSHTLLVS
jgi:hypothetical protein